MRAYVDQAIRKMKSEDCWSPSPFRRLDLDDVLTGDLRFLREEIDASQARRDVNRALREGELGARLEGFGYRWIWHGEEIPRLFLDRLLNRAYTAVFATDDRP